MSGRVPAIERFEKHPGFEGARTLRRIARGQALVRYAGLAEVSARSRSSIQIGPSRHLDTIDPGRSGPDDFINHSCSPNACLAFPALEVRALRDLEPGEEVTLNYCATEEELSEPFTCHCGSPGCYRLVRGYRFLSPIQRESIRDIAAPWLRATDGP